MLSPRMTSAEWLRGDQASTALRKYQCLVLDAEEERVAALTRLPACMCEVVQLPGWPVMLDPDWPGWE